MVLGPPESGREEGHAAEGRLRVYRQALVAAGVDAPVLETLEAFREAL
jgi:hypothetical protein